MKWLALILSSLPAAIVGLICGGLIGQLQISWFRLSEANGTQYFRVVAFAFFGGILGLVLGLVMARLLSTHDTASGLRSAAASSSAVLALALMVLAVSRYFGHVPPTLDGQKLTLQVEVRLPPGRAKPAPQAKLTPDALYESSTSGFNLTSVNTIGRNFGVIGSMDAKASREEQGRWIVPGDAPMETSRGQRALDFTVDGQDIERFIAPVPAHPSVASLQWSGWLPAPDDAGHPWPDSKPSYRFRVQKVEPVKREAELPADEQSDFIRWKAELSAVPADAPLTAYFKFTRYNAPTGINSLAMATMSARPDFDAGMRALMLSENSDDAATALRLIEHVPHPTPELLHAVEAVGSDLADRMRKVNATSATTDPDYLGAADVSVRFTGWIMAVAKLRAKDGGNFIPELRTIVELSRVRNDSEAMRRDVRRVAVSCLSEWAGVPPQPSDPKP